MTVTVEFMNAAGLPVPHGFFTRRGGVSSGPFASLNCSLSGKDSRDNVLENRARAARAIDADPAHLLVVAQAGQLTLAGQLAQAGQRAQDGPQLVATLQLSFIPGLARRGALRAQIEAVRVHEPYRSRGLGAAMMGWAIEEARRRG